MSQEQSHNQSHSHSHSRTEIGSAGESESGTDDEALLEASLLTGGTDPQIRRAWASYHSVGERSAGTSVTEGDLIVDLSAAQQTTVGAAIFNMTNAILGGGILALPYCFKILGIFFGLFILMIIAIIARYSYSLLHKCCTATNQRSYDQVALHHLGPKSAILVMIFQVVYPFGVLSAYHIIMKQNMETAIAELLGSKDEYIGAVFLICLDVLIILPLCLMPNIDSLKKYSALVVCCVIFIVMVVFGKFLNSSSYRNFEWSDVDQFNLNSNFFVALPIIVFSFNCSSQFISIYAELEKPTSDAVAQKLILTPVFLSLILYCFISIFGYLKFKDDVKDNILSSFPEENDDMIQICRVCYTIVLTLSCPVIFQPLRQSLGKLYLLSRHKDPVLYLEGIDHRKASLNHSIQRAPMPNTKTTKLVATVSVLSLVYLVAIFARSLQQVFALTGAIGASTLCYTLPGIMYLQTMPRASWDQKLLPRLLVLFGIFTCISCVVVTLLGISGEVDAAHV
eukprot:TRINITY_DN1591_c0_g1_i6.p1 TRINITY_DN1591_c0_g1~~TRINITY_DN1591_c0_g1_i6.p1  ORF type:complete len:509 (-),score=61.31 TRINITY_DN1591_c0_g1_i6:104-1630(-)